MIDADGLARHFPVHAVIGPGMELRQLGSALRRLAGEAAPPVFFGELFEIERPGIAAPDLEGLRALGSRLCLLRFKPNGMRIRGEFLAASGGTVVLLGSVGVADAGELAKRGLTLNDFTAHDPTADFLMAGATHRATLDDLKRLAELLKQQKEDLQRSNEQLARATAEARHASEVKSRFMSRMSHELRTPLHAIAGFSKLLLDRAYPGDREEFLGAIHESAELLVSLLGPVLDLAKIESGRLEFTPAPFEPRQLVARIMGPQQERARDRGLACRWRVDAPEGVWLSGDPLRIQQVAINLVANAVKFTERGEVELLAEWRDGWFRFEVRDTGPGIPAHELERLFQPFVQAGDPRSHQEGTGLGLAISRELAELMGGSLTADSDGKSGSVFRFEVPAAAVAPPLRDASAELPAPAPRVVMIVDDNDLNLLLGQKLLEREGHSVLLAGDGEQALAMVGHRVPDVILMDVQMPGLDGLETTRELRRRGIGVPIIALTANAVQGDRECCLAAGMDGYLPKPLDLAALHAQLRELGSGPVA